MDLKEEEILGDAIDNHWYYNAKAKMVAHHLDKPVAELLDVGAGSGWFSKWLLWHRHATSATCVDPGYPEPFREEEVAGARLRFVQSVVESSADLVLLMDVLEHVDDDVGLLAQYWSLARPGTRFLITVPAFNALWSAHDDFLEHRRRYTLRTLRETVRGAGAEPLRQHYYFGFILPIAVAVRLMRRGRKTDRSDMSPQPPVVDRVLRAICSAERSLMRFNQLAGLSVVCVIEKPEA